MNRKWIGFTVVATLVAASGFASRISVAQDQEKHDEPETPLGKIMEKVQKLNIALNRTTGTAARFKKFQKDVEKDATELAKLAKDGKPLKEAYLKNAKNESDPNKKWDDIMDAFAKTSKDLASAAAKDGADQKKIKAMFQVVKKTCSDCHTVFRVESEF
ncbi:MAG TPA: cytochrome c [Isosphaeraceae bacterium]|nr:cytochrome c [Isosphaeraceae bacterium]